MSPRLTGLLLASLLAAAARADAPRVVIAEFMAENNGFLLDAFGNASDWLELQNTTGRPVSLLNWSLSDNVAAPAKWRLPDVTLPPWGTLLIWASNADRRDPAAELHTNFALSKNGEYLGLYDADGLPVHAYAPAFPPQYENIAYGLAFALATNTVTLVAESAPARALCPADDSLGVRWRDNGFDDSAWAAGLLPAGYATKNPAWQSEITFSLLELAQGRPGVYLRAAFDLDGADTVQALAFGMTYDDGAAVFLNGAPACGANAPPFDALTHASYAATILGDPATLAPADLSAVITNLVEGRNVLAVHLLNANASSSDLFLKPRLDAARVAFSATNEPAFLARATPGALNGDASQQRLAQTVTFSVSQGIFTSPFTLTLAGALPGQSIRYTTDGAEPASTNGSLYTGPLPLTASRHLRARVFDALGRSGETATAQYTFCAADGATLAFATAMPVLVLRETDPLANGIPTLESSTYTACAAHLIEPAGGSACLTSAPALTARCGIHVRGSSSAGFPKKPYALTFWGEDNDDRNVDLAGFPSGSDFALISCYNYDRTYLHDAFLFELSRQAGRYAPRTRFVEVFLIGSDSADLAAAHYQGLYQLEERVKAGNGRVPVDDIVSPAERDLPGLSGSYLFKADRVDDDEFSWRTSRNFPSSTGRYMVLAYPKLADLQPEQSRYLVDAFNAFEDALFGADPMHPETGVARHVDLLSFADFHLFEMFSMDVDIFTLSSWFHKDRGGKIMAGPLWDLDRSLGPYGYSEASFPNVKRWDAWTFASEPFARADFWGRLHAQPAFRRLYWDRWFELRQSVFSATNLTATLARLKALIPEAAAERDIVKWNMRPSQQFGNTHASEIQWLDWFVTNRVAWIDQNHAAKSFLLRAPALAPAGGTYPAGAAVRVTLDAPEGDLVRYTLDGSDPALWNDQPDPAAHACAPGGAVLLTASCVLTARAYRSADSRWGLRSRATFLLGGRHAEPGDVRLSEVHYHPAAGEPAALPACIARCYEFVELLNVADRDVSLEGCRFPEGRPADALTLGPVLLRPGARAVVARHDTAYESRYGAAARPVACWLYGGLSDSGETVTLLDRRGRVLDTLDYATRGAWPRSADGGGDSLHCPALAPGAPRQPWRAAVPTPGAGSYWEWLGLRGLSAPEADDDGDGTPNLLEYYAGGDPLDPADRGLCDLHAVGAGAAGFSLRFRQARDRPDVWGALQESEDLAAWRDVDCVWLSSEDAGACLLWTLRLPPEALAARPRLFFRLRAAPAAGSPAAGTWPPPLP